MLQKWNGNRMKWILIDDFKKQEESNYSVITPNRNYLQWILTNKNKKKNNWKREWKARTIWYDWIDGNTWIGWRRLDWSEKFNIIKCKAWWISICS